jgi:RNA polymerase sigma factor (sigma-70 family)
MVDYIALSDDELIARCREKDALAWEALVRRYQRLISSITQRFRLDAEDAADILQLVCLKMFQQLPHLRDENRLSSWLITVTVRECWKLRRRMERVDLLNDDDWASYADLPDDRIELPDDDILRLERQHLIRRAVEHLSMRCRTLIKNLFFREVPATYIQIGKILQMPVASIGPTRARCLEKLREQLEKDDFR